MEFHCALGFCNGPVCRAMVLEIGLVTQPANVTPETVLFDADQTELELQETRLGQENSPKLFDHSSLPKNYSSISMSHHYTQWVGRRDR